MNDSRLSKIPYITSLSRISSQETASSAIRIPYGLTKWGGILTIGWVAFTLLMFAPIMWRSPSFLSDMWPGLFKAVTSLMPQWLVYGKGPITMPYSPVEAAVTIAPGWLLEDRWIGEMLQRWSACLLYFALMGCLWTAYRFAMKSVARKEGDANGSTSVSTNPRWGLAVVFIGALVFSATTMLWMGVFSTDVYDYAIQGRMQLLHNLNPFVDPPRTMTGDPFLDLTPWRDKLTVYGPAGLFVVKIVTLVIEPLGGEPVTYLLTYRAINVALILVCTLLVWDIGKRLKWANERLVLAVALFAWCPMMFVELVGNAHNDSLLILCILGAIWLHMRGWWPLAMQLLIVGGMIKLSGYFLVPAYLVLLARSSRTWGEAARRVTGAMAIGLLVGLFAFAPYFHPELIASLRSNPMEGFVVNSPAAAVRTALVNLLMELRGVVTPVDLQWRPALELVRYPMWYGPIYLWAIFMLFFSLRVRDLNSLIRTWFLVLFSYLIVGSVWNWPWYANWLVPFLALMPASYLRRAGLLLVFGSAMSWGLYPIGIYLPGNHVQRLSFLYMPAVIFGPVLLYLAWIGWQALYGWWRNRQGSSTRQLQTIEA